MESHEWVSLHEAISKYGGGMGVKQIIGILGGALVGFLIGYFGRCLGGTA